MKKMKELKKFTSAFLAAAMIAGMLPADAALAVSGSQVAADGTYTKTAHVAQTAADDEDGWTEYDVKVSLEVKDGVFSDITVTPQNGYEDQSKSYFAKAYNKSKGFQTLLKGKEATEDTINGWDAVSTATRTSNAIKSAALDAIHEASEKTAGSAEPEETEDEKTEPVYVLMNIPYADFYEADVNNDVAVDAFSSATLNKTRTASLAGGSYHVDANGSDITGITFPVKVGEDVDLSKYKKVTDEDSVEITVTNRGTTATTTYSGKDALFENESYAYYVLSGEPSLYKEASVNEDGSLRFGEVKGEAQTLSDVEVDLLTETSYGDYQLDLDGLDTTINAASDQVYGVIVSTKEGNDYGMRHLENIWRVSELAWCTGFTSDVHGCPASSAHYKQMMGQHINEITYYTSKGIYKIPVDNLYVPVKFDGSVKVESVDVSEGAAAVTVTGMPDDYDAKYTVDGLAGAVVKDGTLTFSKDAEEGRYTLTVIDQNGKYASLSTTFILTTSTMPAAYSGDDTAPALKAAEGISEEAFNKYLRNISAVEVNGKSYAATGRGAVVIVKDDGTIDTGAQDGSIFGESGAYEITVSATGYHDLTFTYTKAEAAEPDYYYVYAGLTWAEYWAAEDVYAAGSAASSDEKDAKGELDKGAFDAVSRATTNHGLHRGSFQAMTVIYDTEGKSYEISRWSEDGKTIILTDGSQIDFSKGTITKSDGTEAVMAYYEVEGIKYVPVKVAAADYEAFCKAYDVVADGGTLAGGYGEQQLKAYTAEAKVTEKTNGLKSAVRNEDGTFSFTARTTGNDSGLAGAELAEASDITVTVKEANGSYGEFLRVDLTGDGYGALGAKMQAVKWTYYGDDSSCTNALASYGTKFAADNWMHKSMGIQLGLTDSLRCSLPEGTDGTGYWTLTVYALGYKDYTVSFQATAENIVQESEETIDTTALEAAVKKAGELKEDDYTPESWANMLTELQEAKEELASVHTQATVDEAAAHLNAAIEALVKVEAPTEEPTEAPTEAPAEEPTEEPTETPAEEPTETSTEEPTKVPAEETTEAAAEETTEAAAEESTEASTEESTEASEVSSEQGNEGSGISTGTGSGISAGTGAGASGTTQSGSTQGTGSQNVSQTESAVKTGDTFAVYLWLAVLALSLCGGGCLVIFRRRRDV